MNVLPSKKYFTFQRTVEQTYLDKLCDLTNFIFELTESDLRVYNSGGEIRPGVNNARL